MDDFTLLKTLQKELVRTLEIRKAAIGGFITRGICKAKIRRLRLQIQEVMQRIERACDSCYKVEKEDWYK